MLRSRIVTLLVAAIAVLLLAGSADAQRRRRRRRPPPAPETQQAETPDAQGQGASATPGEEGGLEAPGAPPPQQAAAQQAGGAEQPAAAGMPDVDEPVAADQAPADEGIEGDPFDDAPLGPDLGPIREEFTALMDELVQVRSRVATLGRQLFNTRVRVEVQNRAAGDNTLNRIVLSLDGAPIFRADASEFSGEDGRQVFDGFAAPGPHVIAVEVEQRARADDNYRYTMRDSYRFQVVRGKMTEVEIVLDDDSDIAEDFTDDEEGEYDVRTRFRVATRDIDARR